jgi:hypothetical protein
VPQQLGWENTSFCTFRRMIQAGNRPCFSFKSVALFGSVGKMVRQDFDGDDTVETRVAGAVHLTHPSGANTGENFTGP